MLEAIRSRAQGWLAKLILALITIPFALWGIDSYFHSGGRNEVIAEVGDGGITRQAFNDMLKEQADRMRQALGPAFDQSIVESAEFREQVLQAMAEEEAMLQEAKAVGLKVGMPRSPRYCSRSRHSRRTASSRPSATSACWRNAAIPRPISKTS